MASIVLLYIKVGVDVSCTQTMGWAVTMVDTQQMMKRLSIYWQLTQQEDHSTNNNSSIIENKQMHGKTKLTKKDIA